MTKASTSNPFRKTLFTAFTLVLLSPFSFAADSAPRSLSFDDIGQSSSRTPSHYLWMSDAFRRNARFAVDISSRVIRNQGAGVTAYANFIGLDFHKVLSNGDGDWGTLTLQPYLTRIDNLGSHPPFFESANDWELVPRIFNFNYTGLSQGQFNIKVGHMEVPFGLEHVVNTNGTLRDYMHGPNIGVKPDWGTSVNGYLKNFEYEVALLRGTGIEYSSTGDPYLIAGRIGTPRERTLSLGLSFYQGDVQKLPLPDHTLTRNRIALDAILETGPFTLMAEISSGDDEGTNVLNSVLEADWHSANQIWMVFAQVQSFRKNIASDWDTASTGFFGVRYAPDSHWALSAMLKRGLESYANGPLAKVYITQLRYRF